MNAETRIIDCQTTEEHSHAVPTTIITPTPCGELPHNPTQPVQGVSGAVYAPMDTSPKPPSSRLDDLTTLLNETLKQLVIELNKQTNTQPDLKDTVETALQQANWFYDMVGEHIDENHDIESLVDDRVDDRIGDAVDNWLSYSFDINDHCDLDDLMSDAVDAKLEDLVTEKLEQLLEEKIANATITVKL